MNSFAHTIHDNGPVPTVTDLTSNHLLITGQTGSGKTTTTLALLSQLQQSNATTIVLDPTGEYVKLPNTTIYRLGENAYLDVGQFSSQQLLQLAGISQQLAPIVNQAMDALRIMQNLHGQAQLFRKINYPIRDYQRDLSQLQSWANSYPVQLLARQLVEEMVVPYSDQRANYQLLGQQYDYQQINRNWSTITQLRERLISAEFQALFGTRLKKGQSLTELNFVLQMFLNEHSSHKTLVIDLSLLKRYEDCQRIVISLLLKQLLNYRLQNPSKIPVKIVIDEAHRYLPSDERLTMNGIFQVAREGRKCGLGLMLTTQSPLDLPTRLRSQFGNLIVHHLADDHEAEALAMRGINTAQLGVGEAYVKQGLQQPVAVKVALPNWWKKERTWRI